MNGVVWIGAAPALHEKIFHAFHSSLIGGHSGFPVMYKHICSLFHWVGMKAFIKNVAAVEHGVPLMQPKWDQHHGSTRKASKTWSQDRRWATPSPPKDGQDTPGPREGSGWPPGPTSPRGIAPDKMASTSRSLAGGRTTPGGFVRTE